MYKVVWAPYLLDFENKYNRGVPITVKANLLAALSSMSLVRLVLTIPGCRETERAYIFVLLILS